MKKVFIILFIAFLVGCAVREKFVTATIYDKTYPINYPDSIVLRDVYLSLDMYNIDSIPLEKWISNTMLVKENDSIKQYIIKQVLPDEEYSFVVTKFIKKDTVIYRYSVRETALKKM